MSNLLIDMTQPNYMNVDNTTHIFFNFDRSNYEYFDRYPKLGVQYVHIFITTQNSVNESLRHFIEKFGEEYNIMIHIPNKPTTGNLVGLFNRIIVKNDSIKELFELQNDPGRDGEFFHTEPSDVDVRVIYKEDRLSIEAGLNLSAVNNVNISFPEYHYDGDESEGIFENAEQRLDPEKFRDKLIEAFKRDCPPSILKNFKSDQEIFEFISEQGEWKIEEDE